MKTFRQRYPITNDVTTTPDDPPGFEACAEEPFNRSRNMKFRAHRHHVVMDSPLGPLQTEADPEELFRTVQSVAATQPGWRILSADAERGRIEAVATTTLLRFKDDIVIEIRGSALHMRSKSRLGRRDFAANEKRIRAFLAQVSRAL